MENDYKIYIYILNCQKKLYINEFQFSGVSFTEDGFPWKIIEWEWWKKEESRGKAERKRDEKRMGVGILGSRRSAASERVRREPEVYFRVPHRFRKLYSLYEPERLQPTHRWCGSLLWVHAQIEICDSLSLSLSSLTILDLSHPTIYKH